MTTRIDVHVLGEPSGSTGYGGWDTFARTAALPGLRPPWADDLAGRSVSPRLMPDDLAEVTSPANLDVLPMAWGTLEPDGRWHQLSFWGLAWPRGDAQDTANDRPRALTVSFVLHESQFRALGGYPPAVLWLDGEGRLPTLPVAGEPPPEGGLIAEVASHRPYARFVDGLKPGRLSGDEEVRRKCERARLAELARVRGILLRRLSGLEALEGRLRAVYAALVEAERQGSFVVLDPEDGIGQALARLVWLSLPLEVRRSLTLRTEETIPGNKVSPWGRLTVVSRAAATGRRPGWILVDPDAAGNDAPIGLRRLATTVAEGGDRMEMELLRLERRRIPTLCAPEFERWGEVVAWKERNAGRCGLESANELYGIERHHQELRARLAAVGKVTAAGLQHDHGTLPPPVAADRLLDLVQDLDPEPRRRLLNGTLRALAFLHGSWGRSTAVQIRCRSVLGVPAHAPVEDLARLWETPRERAALEREERNSEISAAVGRAATRAALAHEPAAGLWPARVLRLPAPGRAVGSGLADVPLTEARTVAWARVLLEPLTERNDPSLPATELLERRLARDAAASAAGPLLPVLRRGPWPAAALAASPETLDAYLAHVRPRPSDFGEGLVTALERQPSEGLLDALARHFGDAPDLSSWLEALAVNEVARAGLFRLCCRPGWTGAGAELAAQRALELLGEDRTGAHRLPAGAEVEAAAAGLLSAHAAETHIRARAQLVTEAIMFLARRGRHDWIDPVRCLEAATHMDPSVTVALLHHLAGTLEAPPTQALAAGALRRTCRDEISSHAVRLAGEAAWLEHRAFRTWSALDRLAAESPAEAATLLSAWWEQGQAPALLLQAHRRLCAGRPRTTRPDVEPAEARTGFFIEQEQGGPLL